MAKPLLLLEVRRRNVREDGARDQLGGPKAEHTFYYCEVAPRRTLAPAFPVTPGAFDNRHNGDYDSFATRVGLIARGYLPWLARGP